MLMICSVTYLITIIILFVMRWCDDCVFLWKLSWLLLSSDCGRGRQQHRHGVITLFIKLCTLLLVGAIDFAHIHIEKWAAHRTHAHKHTNLHLSKADSKLCLVIVYLTDAIDLTELEESLQSLGLLGSQRKRDKKILPESIRADWTTLMWGYWYPPSKLF